MSDIFGNYQLLSKIATGGMAEIFLAKHINSPVTSMPIAIKKILPQYSNNVPFIKMFLAEARIICNINHDNIVKIYDFGKVDGLYYIAMEYVFGQALGQLENKMSSKENYLPLEIVLEICFSVLNGLQHAHNTKDKKGVFLNVVHLDMNPNNILLSYDGGIKIVDFGIAHATYTKILKHNLASIQGTFGYLSPEQCREEGVDRRSDIFSFGIILYEMLSGKPLYKHLMNDAVILNAILNEEVENIKNIRPDISDELARIVHKALEKDREKRYSSAVEMIEDLQGVQAGLEFNLEAETLPALLKREFAGHYIKMNKILEKAQAQYLMDELFKDIGDIEEMDLHEKVRIAEEEKLKKFEEDRLKKEAAEEKSSFPMIAVAAIVFVLLLSAGIGGYFFLQEEKDILVSLFSDPPEADIFIDGISNGLQTPAEISMKPGRNYIIEFRKDDFIGEIYYTPKKEDNKINLVLKKR